MLHLHTLPKLQQEKIKEKSLNPEGQRERESRWLHINVSNILDNKKQQEPGSIHFNNTLTVFN